MTGINCCGISYPSLVYIVHPDFQKKRVHSLRCCSNASNQNGLKPKSTSTPQLVIIAVKGVTEILRIFSSGKGRLDMENNVQRNGVPVSNVDDVVMTLKLDYENAYFVTGIFTSSIYAEDCLFEDPTIRFRGTELYSRNLKLLVPFFDSPSIALQKIEKDYNSETCFVSATWKLRTFLRLPWRPLISINGTTVYNLDDNFRIIRHAESWDISAVQAISQIFTPSYVSRSE